MIIALEGIIGAGKSHFLEVIRKNFSNVKIFTEGIDKDIYKKSVKDYYTDPHTHAYPFQLTMLWRKMSDGLDAQEYDRQTGGHGIAVIERTISSNNNVFCRIAYQRGYITEDYLKLYNHSYEKLKKALRKPDCVIMLNCPVEFAYGNISVRQREGEDRISIEYLETLQGLYSEWLENYGGRVKNIYFDKFLSENDICDIFGEIISERNKKENELRLKEKRFKELVENMEKCKEELKALGKELKGERF